MQKEIKLNITKELKELVYVKAEVTRFMDVNYVSTSVTYKVSLVLEEVLSSIINHAEEQEKRHSIQVYVTLRDRELILEITWSGTPFNPVLSIKSEEEALEDLEVQQMGAHVVRKLTKSAHYFRRQELNQNQLVITMRSGLH